MSLTFSVSLSLSPCLCLCPSVSLCVSMCLYLSLSLALSASLSLLVFLCTYIFVYAWNHCCVACNRAQFCWSSNCTIKAKGRVSGLPQLLLLLLLLLFRFLLFLLCCNDWRRPSRPIRPNRHLASAQCRPIRSQSSEICDRTYIEVCNGRNLLDSSRRKRYSGFLDRRCLAFWWLHWQRRFSFVILALENKRPNDVVITCTAEEGKTASGKCWVVYRVLVVRITSQESRSSAI